MRKVRFAAGLLLAAAFTAGPAQAMAPGQPPEDFSVIAKVVGATNTGKNTAVFKEVLKAGGEQIGSSRIELEFTKKSVRCTCKWRFDGGRIKANGKLDSKRRVATVAISDGTGLYKGAEGTIRIETVTKRRSRETFNFK